MEGDHGKQRAGMAGWCGSLSQPMASEDGDEVGGHMEVVLTALEWAVPLRVIPACTRGQTPTEAQIK